MIHVDPDRSVLHVAEVRFCVEEGAPAKVERFAGWTAREAVQRAWGRIWRAMRSGEALAYRTQHFQLPRRTVDVG